MSSSAEIYRLLRDEGKTVEAKDPHGNVFVIRPEHFQDPHRNMGYSVLVDGKVVDLEMLLDERMHPNLFDGLTVISVGEVSK